MLPASQKLAEYLFGALKNAERERFSKTLDKLLNVLDATDDVGRPLFLEWTRPNNE